MNAVIETVNFKEFAVSQRILNRVAQGDESAIEECLSAYGGLVWSLAKKYCRVTSDAEDATQDIFLEIWRKAESYNSEISSEATFISMIARRRLIDRLRKSSRSLETVSIEAGLDVSGETGSDQLEVAEEAALAKDCLEQLKPEERKVIELSVYEQLSQTRIAEVLELPLGTVKTHARRGMIRLRSMLQNPNMIGGES